MRLRTEDLIARPLTFIKPDASLDDFRKTCRRMIAESDLVRYEPRTYSRNEVKKLAEGVVSYILHASDMHPVFVTLERDRDRLKMEVNIAEVVHSESSDLLHRSIGVLRRRSEDRGERLSAVIEAYVAICLRYAYCVESDDRVFHASTLVRFTETAREFFTDGDQGRQERELVYAVIQVFASMDQIGPFD
ncbi:hypothetical protein ACYOEI_29935 [Singulisphaera rosea]